MPTVVKALMAIKYNIHLVEGATQATGSLPILTGTHGGGTTTKVDAAAAHLIFGDLA